MSKIRSSKIISLLLGEKKLRGGRGGLFAFGGKNESYAENTPLNKVNFLCLKKTIDNIFDAFHCPRNSYI